MNHPDDDPDLPRAQATDKVFYGLLDAEDEAAEQAKDDEAVRLGVRFSDVDFWGHMQSDDVGAQRAVASSGARFGVVYPSDKDEFMALIRSRNAEHMESHVFGADQTEADFEKQLDS